MSTPLAKRRRLDDSQSVLRKPFRSPFKTPVRPNSKPDGDSASQSSTAQASASQGDTANTSPMPSPAPPDSTKPSISTGRTVTSKSTPSTLTRSVTSPISARKLASGDPLAQELRAEEQKQRKIARQIANVKSEVDTFEQALAISTSTKDQELEELIQKWREASRAAAEEVFGTVRDRVNKMGGVGAWREREQRQQEWKQGFDAAEQEPDLDDTDDDEDDDDELTPEEKEVKRIAKEQRAEARAEARKEREWRKEEMEREKSELEAQQPKMMDEGANDDVRSSKHDIVWDYQGLPCL
ncbi:uncharacterized protein J3D65DRAFT_616709 [Phyllosticta citribraziliensis]|uniref:Swi5-dependent recombination DNA repair protein 1 n=1 Tax=Phyllosticta citribraziliensis TaxID=989973 RepID=A0ABR1M060_9PEZI